MNWMLPAFSSVIAISFANIFQRVAMRDQESDPISSSIFFQISLSLITGIFAYFIGFNVPPISEYFWNFLISSVFYAIGTLAYFNAAKNIEASEITIISGVGVFTSLILSVIFLKESVSFIQVLGSIIIIISVYLLQKSRKITWNKGVLFALSGSTAYAIALTSDAFILKTYDAVSYTPIMSFLPGLILLGLCPSKIRAIFTMEKKFVLPMLTYSFFYGVQAVSYYFALQSGANVSQMSPIYRVEIILTVLLASIFLGERDSLVLKIICSVMAFIGVLLVM